MLLSDPFLAETGHVGASHQISFCLDPSSFARSQRQAAWIEYLRTVCHEDAVKWRNKCSAMLRRIRRIRESIGKSISDGDAGAIASRSPTMREHRFQSAVEELSIHTGMDYEQSKNVLISSGSPHGERGGTADDEDLPPTPEQRLRRFLDSVSTSIPFIESAPAITAEPTSAATYSAVADPAFARDEQLAQSRSVLYQLWLWFLSRSLWVVTAFAFTSFLVNASWLSAIPLLLVVVVGLASFPFPSHRLWSVLVIFTLTVIAAKLVWQSDWICDDPSSWCLFSIASRPTCPPVYVVSRAVRLGLYKLPQTSSSTAMWVLELVWSELMLLVGLLVHVRSLRLSGRSRLTPGEARRLISGDSISDARPTRDTYSFRFALSLIVTVLLITDWANISASKLPVSMSWQTSSVFGESFSRNYFSPTQVAAVTLFILQIAADRCLYTLMSHSPGTGMVEMLHLRKIARLAATVSVAVQAVVLLLSMNLRIILPFFLVYGTYLVLSARQLAFDIRPVGGKSGFLWKSGRASYYAFRAYLAVPFLDELRQLCDWAATPATALSLFMWFKVEDCLQNMRAIQVEMDSRRALPMRRADRACIGGSAVMGLVAVITGPLVFFSGLNVLREQNLVVPAVPGVAAPSSLRVFVQVPNEVSRIELYSSNQINTTSVNPDSFRDDEVLAPLLVLQSADVQRVSFPSASDADWSLSPPLERRLTDALRRAGDGNVSVTAEWLLVRQLSPGPTSLTSAVQVPAASLLETITNPGSQPVTASGLIPTAAYLDSTSTAKIVDQDATESPHTHTQLRFTQEPNGKRWWSMEDSSGILCVSERTMGSAASSGSSGFSISVIGLYIGVVLTVGRFLRLSLQGSSKRIDVEELPNTETVIQLCQGIQIARMFKDTPTEKQLYYDLVKLFRDPQLLQAATGPTVLRE